MIDVENLLQNPQQIIQYIKNINLDNSLVYFAGSLMEGFGNARSDVDIYVVCEEVPQELLQQDFSAEGEIIIIQPKRVVHDILRGEIRYGIEYWTWSDFNEAVNYINTLNFKTNKRLKRIHDNEYDLLHRIKYGKPIINKEKFESVYNSIAFENLNMYFAIFQAQLYSSFLEDVQGAYISGDKGSAFFMARRLIDIVTTSFLATKGETNPNNKWMYRKLLRYQQNNGDDELMKKYIYFHTHTFEPKTVDKYIKEAVGFCQELNLRIQSQVSNKQLTNSL